MNANANRPVATGARRASKGSGMRVLARALLVLPAAVLGTAASAYPHRELPVDECVQAAVARMGVGLTQRIGGAARLIGDAETARVVYLDVATPGGRLPVRMRLYCSVNERGEIEHVLSMPRLTHAG